MLGSTLHRLSAASVTRSTSRLFVPTTAVASTSSNSLHNSQSRKDHRNFFRQACAVPAPSPAAAAAAALGLSGSKLCRSAGTRTMAAAAAANGLDVPAGQEVAVLGGGCFWCLEACYQQLKGVSSVVSGYAGGHVNNPTYRQVCDKGTGHAEVVAVTFDPAIITFRDLLDVFFTIHDPTTPNRQGADVGPQYRSIICYTSEQQKKTAEEAIAEVSQQGIWPSPIVTELVPLGTAADKFWPAEDYHQNYYNDNPSQGYCRAVVAPKVAKFRSKYMAKLMA